MGNRIDTAHLKTRINSR